MITDMKTYKISGALASQVLFKNGKAVGGKIYYENVKKDRIMTNADFMRYKLEY
jgi:antitoxin component YwqK of YwqJK toxin-antitoxin module